MVRNMGDPSAAWLPRILVQKAIAFFFGDASKEAATWDGADGLAGNRGDGQRDGQRGDGSLQHGLGGEGGSVLHDRDGKALQRDPVSAQLPAVLCP
jgi:hypothetical protein